jgi:hypothetical protein
VKEYAQVLGLVAHAATGGYGVMFFKNERSKENAERYLTEILHDIGNHLPPYQRAQTEHRIGAGVIRFVNTWDGPSKTAGYLSDYWKIECDFA